MRSNTTFRQSHAVSQIIGAVLLLFIALVAGALIYNQVLPVSLPSTEPNVHLMGYVTEDGVAIIEHMGGESLPSYEIQVDGQMYYVHEKNGDSWEIGENFPLVGYTLLDEEDEIRIAVYSLNDDGGKDLIFNGILSGSDYVVIPYVQPMLISTLQTNTVDEDLICYDKTIESVIDPITFIYNWTVNGNPLTRLLLPFDTNTAPQVKDYSGHDNDGTNNGATWIDSGKSGGGYSFTGNEFITLPYCFDQAFLDQLTVEAWIKTSQDSSSVLSYDRSNYWELGIDNGNVAWSTTATDGTTDTMGSALVNDDVWHHIAASYNAVTGRSSLYIDGILDMSELSHTSGKTLGSGDEPSGFIGRGTGGGQETIFSTSFETPQELSQWNEDNDTWGGGGDTITWETLYADSFEGGSWGHWNDGGWDCEISCPTSYAYEGSCAVYLRDNSWTYSYWHSSTYSDSIAAQTAGYTQLKLDFWWITDSFENGENIYVGFYDGSGYTWLENYVIGTGSYNNHVFYHSISYVNETEYTLTNQMRFIIRSDASSDTDHVYVDKIYVNTTRGSRLDYEFDLRDATALNPHTGSYSIGGSGDFDPDFAYFNRTSIDIAEYSDVVVSLWYSYESTESDDAFGLYYKDGANWIPIIEELSPQIGNGNQLDWTYVEVTIPDYLDALEFQFMWSTSSVSEFIAIDDLSVTGMPPGMNNYSGLIDEVRIYNRELSPEQIYQNYLSQKEGYAHQSVIVAEETLLGEIWKCYVTPNNSIQDDELVASNTLTIIPYLGGG